jgi:hypothetical protein
LNHRPRDYDSPALPLSYAAIDLEGAGDSLPSPSPSTVANRYF